MFAYFTTNRCICTFFLKCSLNFIFSFHLFFSSILFHFGLFCIFSSSFPTAWNVIFSVGHPEKKIWCRIDKELNSIKWFTHSHSCSGFVCFTTDFLSSCGSNYYQFNFVRIFHFYENISFNSGISFKLFAKIFRNSKHLVIPPFLDLKFWLLFVVIADVVNFHIFLRLFNFTIPAATNKNSISNQNKTQIPHEHFLRIHETNTSCTLTET